MGDVSGDGWPEVAALSERPRAVTLFLGGARGSGPACTCATEGRAQDIAVADLDGDGRAEVLLSDSSGERLLVMGVSR